MVNSNRLALLNILALCLLNSESFREFCFYVSHPAKGCKRLSVKRKREYGYGFSYANRPQNLPLAERAKRRKTRCKDLKSQIAFRKNDQRGKDAMGKYRKGYKLMMKNPQVRKRLLSLGFRDFG